MYSRVIAFFVILVVAVAVSAPILYALNEGRLKRRYEDALNRIQIGDSEETVIALMGQPDQRDWCYPLPKDREPKQMKQFHQRCFITYRYVTFMEHYGVSLDKDNRVSGTFRSVSP